MSTLFQDYIRQSKDVKRAQKVVEVFSTETNGKGKTKVTVDIDGSAPGSDNKKTKFGVNTNKAAPVKFSGRPKLGANEPARGSIKTTTKKKRRRKAPRSD